MQTRELSLVGKLDTGLSRGFCLLLTWLSYALVWLLGLLMLSGQPALIFEYDEGLADISWHEWAYMLLFVLLLWRHIHYCRCFATGFWRGLSQLLTFQGRLCFVMFATLGLTVGLEQAQGVSVDLLNTMADPMIELISSGLILLTVCLAVPSAPSESVPQTLSPRVEPTLIRTEKDVTA
jgi:hypothetical protein